MDNNTTAASRKISMTEAGNTPKFNFGKILYFPSNKAKNEISSFATQDYIFILLPAFFYENWHLSGNRFYLIEINE